MKNEGFNAMSFLFIIPILFIVGCIILDFVLIYKQKVELKNDLDYIVDLYKMNDEGRIMSYSNEHDFKVEKYSREDKVEFVLIKEVKFKTPVPKLVFGELYKIEVKKTIDK